MIAPTWSIWPFEKGVYDVIRKWQRGVGIKEARIPTRELCIAPGYLNVWVLEVITVAMSWLV